MSGHPTRDFWITVHGPRAASFEKVFGSTSVPVISPAHHLATLPGFDEPQEVYLLDLDWAAEQGVRTKIVRHLAAQFGIPAESLDQNLEKEGLPLLAADTTLAIHNPQKWVG